MALYLLFKNDTTEQKITEETMRNDGYVHIQITGGYTEVMFNLLKQKSQEYLSKLPKPKLSQLTDKLLTYYLQVTNFLLVLSQRFYPKVWLKMLALIRKSLKRCVAGVKKLLRMALKVMDKIFQKVLPKKVYLKVLDLFKKN